MLVSERVVRARLQGMIVHPGQFIEVDDLVRISILLTYIKYLFYSIWVLPVYRAVMVFRSWRANYQRYSVVQGLPRSESSSISVAVLIPARNSARFIAGSLLSVLNQSLAPRTIYILDDASTDKTAEIVLDIVRSKQGRLKSVEALNDRTVMRYEIVLKDERVVQLALVSFKTHVGKPRMINSVLREVASRHDYIVVLDSDTILEKDYVEKVVSFLVNNRDVAGASGTILLWRPEGRSKASWLFARGFRNIGSLSYQLLIRFTETVFGSVNSLSGCCSVFRAEKLVEVGGIPEDTYSDDMAIAWELQIRGYKVAYLPGAVSFTADPSSPRRLLAKMCRITLGMQKLFFTRFRRIIKKRKWNLMLTGLYTSFGSIPFVFVLMNIVLTMLLVHMGVYNEGGSIAYSLFQFTPLSVILAFIYRYPVSYLAVSYVVGVAEGVALSLLLLRLYRDNQFVRAALRTSMKSVVFLPFTLWIQALVTLIVLPVSMYQVAVKKNVSKW
ncbi:MAG: glycosyltransferase family 2 protein [Fervidicoccaceae archaeon]|nr:glycosyltransferase family 2 protein [Fervidicoccaceae archaeon]